jgi:SpoVK/Ycf46/Vps4 family AAA+-type ATPase
MDDNVKELIVNKLEKFYESSALYDKYGITWKRVHLLHSLPGTGKSSFVLAVASKFNKNIAKLTLTPELNSQDLEKLFQSVPDNTILLLEDVNDLFTGRKSNSSISFSTVLNCLDGITTKRGLVLFMTTNHISELDEALVRPGRIDTVIEFFRPNENDVKKALDVLAADYKHEHEEFMEKVKDQINKKELTIPWLQKHLFDCIMDEKKSVLDF